MLTSHGLKRTAFLVLLLFSFICLTGEFYSFGDMSGGAEIGKKADHFSKTDDLSKEKAAKGMDEEISQESPPRFVARESKNNQSRVKAGKKRFPWLLAVVGAGLVVTLVLLLAKKRDSTRLTVTLDEGVLGGPAAGNHSYKKGESISYSYSLATSSEYIYEDLLVKLDGKPVTATGTIIMDRHHTLSVEASRISAIYPMIYSYYWENGWVELARWESRTVLRELTIDMDAGNGDPYYYGFYARFDNFSAHGDILPGGSIRDDFYDGIIDSIWKPGCSEGATVIEANGVLQVDIPSGKTKDGLNHVGGIITYEYVIQGDFDVQVDFEVNPEFHQSPTVGAKLFLTDRNNNSLEMAVYSNSYKSGEFNGALNRPSEVVWKETRHLSGKLRIVMKSPPPRSL